MGRLVGIGVALAAVCLAIVLWPGGASRGAGAFPSTVAAEEVTVAPLAGEAAGGEDVAVGADPAAEAVPETVVSEREAVAGVEHPGEEAGVFTLEGVVLPGVELGIEEDARVQVFRVDREKRYEVGSADVGEEGRWEPLEVPLDPGVFLARFQSFQAIPVELDLGRPEADEVVPVEFQVRKGGVLFFEVLDPGGETLREATIRGTWRTEDGGTMSRTALVRPDGFYAMRGLPEGVIETTAEAEGYERRQSTFLVPEVDPVIHVVQLASAMGRVLGRCEQGGEPVADFDLFLWDQSGRSGLEQIRFRDTDGSFVLQGLGPGTYRIVAQVLGSNQSHVEFVTVPEQGESEIVLRVPEPVFLSGRVVSAADGAPVAGATVRLALSGRARPETELGEPRETAADGRFEGLPATPETCRLWIRAPGFGVLNVAVPGPGSPTDMGDLLLQPAEECEIRLLAEPGTNLKRFVLAAAAAGLPSMRFPSDGVLRFAAGVGRHAFFINDTLGGFYVLTLDLRPGESRTWEVRVGGGLRVFVDLHAADPEDEILSSLTYLRVSRDIDGGTQTYKHFGLAPPIVLENQEPGRIRIEAVRDEEVVGTGVFTLTSEPEQFLDLEIGLRGALLRLVDGKGEPVPNAEVLVADTDPGDFYWPLATDGRGRVRLPGVRQRKLFLTIRHPTLGSRTALPVTLPEDPEEEIVVVLDPQHRVRVHVTHDGAPVSGIGLHLLTGRRLYHDLPRITDAQGVVEWQGISAGDYRLRVEQAGYWFDHSLFTVGDSDTDVFFELRRLGRLEVRVTNADGLPVSGASIGLRHLDLGVSLRDLAADLRWVAPDSGLVTNGRGVLEVEDLPEGRYQWSLVSAGGDPLGGVVRVEGDGLARVAVRLP